MPHLNYSLLAWGTKSNKIELLQKKAIRVLYSKSPIAHTAPLYIKMKQPKLSDLYICNLLKLYHKLYRNRLPPYFDTFLPEFGEHNHMLRNEQIQLPVVRCEFGEMNAKYQMSEKMSEVHVFGSNRCIQLQSSKSIVDTFISLISLSDVNVFVYSTRVFNSTD